MFTCRSVSKYALPNAALLTDKGSAGPISGDVRVSFLDQVLYRSENGTLRDFDAYVQCDWVPENTSYMISSVHES